MERQNSSLIAIRFPALASRDYVLFVTGQLISVIGTWMQATALPYLAYRMTGRPLDLGLIGFSSTLPTLLFALPAGVLVEIMNDDGTMARLPELMEVAKKFDFRIVSIKDLIEYRIKRDSLIDEVVSVDMPTKYGSFKLVAFREKHTSNENLALIKGEWEKDEPVMVRVHSSCFTGDILGSLRCDCGEQLHASMKMVEKLKT